MDSPIASSIKKLIDESRTSDALAMLIEASRPNKQVHNALDEVLGEFNALTAQRLRGTIDETEATLRLQIIHHKMLIALNAFDSEGKPLPNSRVYGSGLTPEFLLRLGLYLLGGALALVVLSYMLQAAFPNLGGGKLGFLVLVAAYYLGMGGFCVLGVWLLSLAMNPVKGR